MSAGNSETKIAPENRKTGYGLPCAKCNTYYFADLKECPVCHARERIAQLAVTSVKLSVSASPKKISSPDIKPFITIAEKRSAPSLTVIPKILEIPADPPEAAMPAASAISSAPVAAGEECLEIPSTSNVANEEGISTSKIELQTMEPEPLVMQKKGASFVGPGSVGDCWSIIMGHDRSKLIPTSRPEPPKEIPATEFSERCVQLLEEIYVSGDTVVITSMGRPVAKIVPMGDDALKLTGS